MSTAAVKFFKVNSLPGTFVADATGDTTVAAGAAMYFYNKTADTYTKVAEYESMDVTVTWASISGKPSSSPSAIDDAVSKVHTHSNKAVLDKWSEDASGNPLYNSSLVQSMWNGGSTPAW